MRFALSVECRDKFFRAVYFGSKMIENYASDNLSDESKESLGLIQSTVSTSRKAFRWFKSITHLSKVLNSLAFKEEEIGNGDIEVILNLLVEFSWMIAFFYDNKIFLARTKIVRFDEKANFRGFTQWWTAADAFNLIRILFTLKILLKERQKIESGEVSGRFDSRSVTQVSEKLGEINKQIKFAIFRLVKYIMCLLVSGEFSGLWKLIFARRLDPGTQGLFGMISGLMDLYEEIMQLKGDDVASIDASLQKIFSSSDKNK